MPDGVAALVEQMDGDKVVLALVNTDQVKERTLIVRAGGYGEHQF